MITTLATLCAILAFALLMAAAVTLGESGCGRGRVLGGATPKKWNYILSENKPELARLTYGKYSTYEALYKM